MSVAACSSDVIDGPIDYATSGGLTGTGEGTSLHIELDGTGTRTRNNVAMPIALDAATLNRTAPPFGGAARRE